MNKALVTKAIMRGVGSRVAYKAAEKHTQNGGALDARFGFGLLRDKRIPVGKKAVALLLGAGLTALLVGMELPLEALLAFFLPFVGSIADMAIDGLELILCPVLFASLILPRLAPAEIVAQIRGEQALRIN